MKISPQIDSMYNNNEKLYDMIDDATDPEKNIDD